MIEEILTNYNIPGQLISIKKCNTGNINTTFIIEYDNNGNRQRYLIQKINTNIFKNPNVLMNNIYNVTKYLKTKMILDKDTEHKVLELLKTKNGNLLCKVINSENKEEYYRIYNYIENSISYNDSFDNRIVYNTGKAFGNFNRLLDDYPIETLEEIIKDFHDTKKRYKNFLKDIMSNKGKRVGEVYTDIFEIIKRKKLCDVITKELKNGSIPYRVTHNDTKINNVMINKTTGDYLAVIDLDTVMPGSLLFDYGDGIRSTASSVSEEETDLEKVKIDMERFKYYTEGYMSEMAEYITENEVKLMGESIIVITLELAMRFLNDYINGDEYFKIEYEHQNLYRARNQIELVKDIEKNMKEIKNYIDYCYKKYKNKENKEYVLKKVTK